MSEWVTFEQDTTNLDGTVTYRPVGSKVLSLTLNGGDIQGEFYNDNDLRMENRNSA